MNFSLGITAPTWEKRWVSLKGHIFTYKRPTDEVVNPSKSKVMDLLNSARATATTAVNTVTLNDTSPVTIDLRDTIVSDEGNKVGRGQNGVRKELHYVLGLTVKSTGQEIKFSSEHANEAEEWLYLIQEAGAACYNPNNRNSIKSITSIISTKTSDTATAENDRNIKQNVVDTPSTVGIKAGPEKVTTIIKEIVYQRSHVDVIIILLL